MLKAQFQIKSTKFGFIFNILHTLLNFMKLDFIGFKCIRYQSMHENYVREINSTEKKISTQLNLHYLDLENQHFHSKSVIFIRNWFELLI